MIKLDIMFFMQWVEPISQTLDCGTSPFCWWQRGRSMLMTWHVMHKFYAYVHDDVLQIFMMNIAMTWIQFEIKVLSIWHIDRRSWFKLRELRLTPSSSGCHHQKGGEILLAQDAKFENLHIAKEAKLTTCTLQ